MNLRVPSDPLAEQLERTWPKVEEDARRIQGLPSAHTPPPTKPRRQPLPFRTGSYSPDDLTVMEDMWPDHCAKAVAVRLRRPTNGLRVKAHELGLRRR